MVHDSYDVIVLGCGSAGSRAAAQAALLGAKTLAVDGGERLGGLCILRGCMPTKTLLETAHRLHEIRDAQRFGIRVGEPELDHAAQMERMRALVARFQRAKVAGIEAGDYELARAPARFVDAHRVEVGGRRVRAKAFVIATGSEVAPLPFPVEEGVPIATSDDMFELERIPETAVVVGAGAVGLEFATWLARCGARVTHVNRSAFLWRSDPELGAELAGAMRREMEVVHPAKLVGLEKGKIKACALRFVPEGGEERVVECDLFLNALGRRPELAPLRVEAAGLAVERGRLTTDGARRTEVAHVFVAGDAAGERLILHEAVREGIVAGRNAARVALGTGEALDELDARVPPLSVLFTDPVYASVGLTRKDCEERGIAHRFADKRFPEQGRGIVIGAEFGRLRLLAEPGGGKVLGCQILGPRADDLIHVPAAVLSMGGSVEEMDRIPWYHPTLTEAFVEVCRELRGT